MASATTIRVSELARDRLNELARAASTTTIDYVDQLVARLDEEELISRIVDSLTDPTIVEESAEIDATLMDGLDTRRRLLDVAAVAPRQGEVLWCVLDPVTGSEIATTRPVLVIRIDQMNAQRARRSIVVPLTTTRRPAGVSIDLEVKGILRVGCAEAYQVRTVSHDRLTTKIGTASTKARRAISKQIALRTRTAADIA